MPIIFLVGCSQYSEKESRDISEKKEQVEEARHKACENMQVLSTSENNETFRWLGTIAPDKCLKYLTEHTDRYNQLLQHYKDDGINSCIKDCGKAFSIPSKTKELCESGCQNNIKFNKEYPEFLLDWMLLPSFGCYEAANTILRNDKAVSGVCFSLPIPEKHTEQWKQIMLSAYTGLNSFVHGGYRQCVFPNKGKKLPILEAVSKYIPIGIKTLIARNFLEDIGFKCSVDPKEANKINCYMKPTGFRFKVSPKEPGGIYPVFFEDGITVVLESNGNSNLRNVCGWVMSVGL